MRHKSTWIRSVLPCSSERFSDSKNPHNPKCAAENFISSDNTQRTPPPTTSRSIKRAKGLRLIWKIPQPPKVDWFQFGGANGQRHCLYQPDQGWCRRHIAPVKIGYAGCVATTRAERVFFFCFPYYQCCRWWENPAGCENHLPLGRWSPVQYWQWRGMKQWIG